MQFTADERKKEDIFHGLRGFPTGSTPRVSRATFAPAASSSYPGFTTFSSSSTSARSFGLPDALLFLRSERKSGKRTGSPSSSVEIARFQTSSKSTPLADVR